MYPSVRFRDMAIETVNLATGGTATLITPFASEVGDELLGDGIIAELVTQMGTDAVAGVADQALIGEYLGLGWTLIFASTGLHARTMLVVELPC